MTNRRKSLVLATAAAALGFAALPLLAFDAPKNPVFSVDDPIRVGDTQLGAGTYVIRVVRHDADLNLLQVTDRDGMTVHTTFQARQRPVLESEIVAEGTLLFDDVPGTAHLLRSWTLPNRSFSYDIVTNVPRPANQAALIVKGTPSARAAR